MVITYRNGHESHSCDPHVRGVPRRDATPRPAPALAPARRRGRETGDPDRQRAVAGSRSRPTNRQRPSGAPSSSARSAPPPRRIPPPPPPRRGCRHRQPAEPRHLGLDPVAPRARARRGRRLLLGGQVAVVLEPALRRVAVAPVARQRPSGRGRDAEQPPGVGDQEVGPLAAAQSARPSAIGASPAQRPRPSQSTTKARRPPSSPRLTPAARPAPRPRRRRGRRRTRRRRGRSRRPSPSPGTAASRARTAPRSPPTTAAGITTTPIAGTASRLATSPYCASTLKWNAEIRRGRGRPRPARSPRPPSTGRAKPPAGRSGSRCHQARVPQPLEGGDQRDGGGEGHLEPRPGSGSPARATSTTNAASATERMVSAGRSSRTATSTVGGHDVGALGRHLGARDDEIGRPAGQRRHSRDLLQRPVQRQPRHQRQPVAHDREDRRGDQAHVQPRDRHDVVERRDPQRLLDRPVDARAVAGQDRRGEGAVLPRTRAWMCAESAMRSRNASWWKPAGVAARRLEHRRAGVADGAEPVEPGDRAEVEAAGLGRRRRRRQPRLPMIRWPGSSDSQRRRRVERDPHPRRRGRRARPRGSPPGRAARAAGRSPSGRGRRPAPRPFAVISWGSTGAATARPAAPPRAKPSPGSSSARSSSRATGPTRTSVADQPTSDAAAERARASSAAARPGARSRARCRGRRAPAPRAPASGAAPRPARRCARPRPLFSRPDRLRRAMPEHGCQEVKPMPSAREPARSSPASPPRRPATCTSAARAPRSSTGSTPATPAAPSCCGSRTPTAPARPPRRRRRSSTG